MNSSNHDYESTKEIPATMPERRHITKAERIGFGLAAYALQLAGEGHINIDVFTRSGIFGHIIFIRNHPEVYDIANQYLAQEGLAVQRMGLSDSEAFANFFAQDVMRILDISDVMTLRSDSTDI